MQESPRHVLKLSLSRRWYIISKTVNDNKIISVELRDVQPPFVW